MKIKSRLSFLFTLFSAVLLGGFTYAIYLTYLHNREEEFYKKIQLQAVTKADLLLEAKVEAATLQTIYQSSYNVLFQEEVAIYNTDFELLYHDAVEIDIVKETPKMLERIKREGEIFFKQDDWQVAGIRYEYEGQTYLITAAAYDAYGFQKLENLKYSLFVILAIMLLVIYFTSHFFARKALKPLIDLNQDIGKITASNLDLRLSRKESDEITEISESFNHMLDRLEKSFNAQKNFVSNIAHELRTPLAALMAELEIATLKRKGKEELLQAVKNSLDDARRMRDLTQDLLDLAKASYETSEITMSALRVDELLMESHIELKRSFQDYHIQLIFDETEDLEMEVYGNSYLLLVTFKNLMENACKFSTDQSCKVQVGNDGKNVVISFHDKGPGIPQEDVVRIFEPFFRGDNAEMAEGTGVGLSLCKRIVEIHNGNINVDSTPDIGSTFIVRLPNL
ncbi:HAMP domain-containing histidine kinase [Litoribacter ruber]|uniref:sensor histidine kinase n=1 Tax=Litoribacter ruber TaxID=702568 RepID=UPI001BDB09A2|nr:HAMP domain-containing sensor histidine kinase [Litoribacter ruber]MBT0809717.1 HAMP domain-containing histidine kinase [Litoribacter ruber]